MDVKQNFQINNLRVRVFQLSAFLSYLLYYIMPIIPEFIHKKILNYSLGNVYHQRVENKTETYEQANNEIEIERDTLVGPCQDHIFLTAKLAK